MPPVFSTEPREGNLSLNSWVLGCAPSVFHFDFESQEGKLTLGYLAVPPVFSTEPREGNLSLNSWVLGCAPSVFHLSLGREI